MTYAKSYKEWMEDKTNAGVTPVINEFKFSFILTLRKGNKDQMIPPDSPMKRKNKKHKESDIVLKGRMSDLKIYFTPHIYNQILNISKLLSMDEENDGKGEVEHQLVNEKHLVVKMASKIGLVKVKYIVQGS